MRRIHARSGMKVRLSDGDFVTLVTGADGEQVALKVRRASYGDTAVLLKAGDEPVAVRCLANFFDIHSKVRRSSYRIGDKMARIDKSTEDGELKPYHYAMDAAIPPFEGEDSQVDVVSGNANAGVSGEEALRRFGAEYKEMDRDFSLGIAVEVDAETGDKCFVQFQKALGYIATSKLVSHGSYSETVVYQQNGHLTIIDEGNAILPFVEMFFNSPSIESLDAACVATKIPDRINCYLFCLNFPRRYFGEYELNTGVIYNNFNAEEIFIRTTVCPTPNDFYYNFQIPPNTRYRFQVERIESIEREIGMPAESLLNPYSEEGVIEIARKTQGRFPLGVTIGGATQRPSCYFDIQYMSSHPEPDYVFQEIESWLSENELRCESVYCNPFVPFATGHARNAAYYRNGTLIGNLVSDTSNDGVLPISGVDYTNIAHDLMQRFISEHPDIAFVSVPSRALRVGINTSGGLYRPGESVLFYHWLDLSAHSTLQRDPTPGGAEYGVNYFFMPYGFEPIRPSPRDIKNLAIFVSTDEISDYYTPDDGFELFRQDIEELQQEANLFTGDSLKIVILDRASLVTPNSQDNTCPTVDTDAPGDPLPDVSPVVNLQENGMPTGDRYIEIFEQSADGRPINRLIVVLDSSGSMRGSVLYNPINDALDELIAYVDAEYPGIQTEINNISNEAWAFNANYYISRADPPDNIVLISIINESTPYGPATAPNYGLFKSDITSLKNTLASPPCVAASVVNIDVPSLWPDTGLSDTVAPFSDTTHGSSVDRPEFITIATELEVFGDVEINGQTHDPYSRWPPIIDVFGGEVDYAYALYDTSRSARSAVDCENDADRFVTEVSRGTILSQSGRTKKAGFDDERWAKAVAAAIREINLVNANA